MNAVPGSREGSLFFIFLGLVLFFALTGLVVRSYHAKQTALAQEWFAQGEAALNAASFEAAVQSYQAALIYSRDNTAYELRLAQALLGASRFREAKAYLEALWEREPGNGIVNLELGRQALRDQDYSSAVSYFHNAIYGVWETDPEGRRRQARLELIQLLLDHGAKEEAQGELITLAANLPNDAALHTQVGALFLSADASNRALQEFRRALQINRSLAPALAGAGEAAFQMEDYIQARQYLRSAIREDPANSRAAGMLETATLVVELDPSARRLSARERANRILRGFGLAWKRIEDCVAAHPSGSPGSESLAELHSRAQELKPSLRVTTIRRDSDLETKAMDLIDEIEEATAQFCGQPTGGDLALLLIARRRERVDR